MRDGYILLHRQGITPEEWKTPERTLAWIDLLTLTNFENGIVTVSYGFLANRWRVGKSTVFKWMAYWMKEDQITKVGERTSERQGERWSERKGERYFVVNYAKYQRQGERVGERKGERQGERKGEPMNKDMSSKSPEPNHTNTGGIDFEIERELARYEGVGNPKAYVASLRRRARPQAVAKAWSEWRRGNGIDSPSSFYSRCIHWEKELAKGGEQA
jgi:hypothetical protein